MRKIWQTSLLTIGMALGSASALGFGDPKHSSVDVETKKAGEKITFDFKIKANEGMKTTFDAPWTLEIKGHDGLSFSQTKMTKAELDENLPGFSVTTSAVPTSAKGELEYRLTSFICTADKTQCFREVHKGKAPWTTPPS